MIPYDLMKELKKYNDAYDKIWEHITGLENFTKECTCENLDSRDTFDNIDYTADTPQVIRFCLKCGGHTMWGDSDE